jgi:hypothetical protein
VLLISVARLLHLDGREILGRGVTPDVEVSWDPSVHPPLDVPGDVGRDPQLAAAVRWIRSG